MHARPASSKAALALTVSTDPTEIAGLKASIDDIKVGLDRFSQEIRLTHVQSGLFCLRAFGMNDGERPQVIRELQRKEKQIETKLKQVRAPKAIENGSHW